MCGLQNMTLVQFWFWLRIDSGFNCALREALHRNPECQFSL